MVTKTRRIEKNVIRCAQTPGPSSQAAIKNNSLHIESETGPIYISDLRPFVIVRQFRRAPDFYNRHKL